MNLTRIAALAIISQNITHIKGGCPMFGYSYNLQSLGVSGFLVFLIFTLVYVAVSFVLRWNMFIKAGEPGWKSLIPFYSDYT